MNDTTTKSLASIAFSFRFANMTDEEEAELLPFTFSNFPQPVKTESRSVRRFGKGEQPCFTEITETFADGSAFSR